MRDSGWPETEPSEPRAGGFPSRTWTSYFALRRLDIMLRKTNTSRLLKRVHRCYRDFSQSSSYSHKVNDVEDQCVTIRDEHVSLGESVTTVHGDSAEEEIRDERKVSVCLPSVFLPKELEAALQSVLTAHARKEHVKDGQLLTHYLQNRIPDGCEWDPKWNPKSSQKPQPGGMHASNCEQKNFLMQKCLLPGTIHA